MKASISTDILSIASLCFTIYFANKNIVINKYKNKIYISVSVITIVLLILEIIANLMQPSNSRIIVTTHRIVNIIGFSLSPVVPFMLSLLKNNKSRGIFCNSLLAIPLCINAFIAIMSYKTGWIFLVNYQNQYSRGNLFLLTAIISYFYFILAISAVFKSINQYEADDKAVLVLIIFMPILGTIFQILFKEVLLIWGTVSTSLLIYYIFLRELQFKYDVQTGIKNRSAFQKEMDRCIRKDKNTAIVVFDVNNLKDINDKYGHKAGDEVIYYAAKSINDTFLGKGKVFRIGGDEFCVICNEVSQKFLDNNLFNLDKTLSKLNENRNNKVIIAYGYAFYIPQVSESIYSTFTEADKAMYAHKIKLKSGNGSLIKDCI